MAASLLRRLEVKAQRQRDSLEGQGLRVDSDTWLWPDGEPNYESLLVGEARAFARGDDACLQEYLAFQRISLPLSLDLKPSQQTRRHISFLLRPWISFAKAIPTGCF
jgi:hypothetical protein